jgi:YfiR/HmsC-like
MKRVSGVAFWILLGIFPSPAQDRPVEYQVKAGFLLNFAKFIEWPADAFPARDTAFTICLADDRLQGALEQAVQGETWNGRPLLVKPIDSGSDVRQCQVVYISLAARQKTMEILMAAANVPVLTVGETTDFITAGGIIRFTQGGRRIRFEINPDAAERVSLRVSSRLLRLADIVRPRVRAGD